MGVASVKRNVAGQPWNLFFLCSFLYSFAFVVYLLSLFSAPCRLSPSLVWAATGRRRLGSLPRSLWLHDEVVWVRSSAQGSVRRRRIPEGSNMTTPGEVGHKTIRVLESRHPVCHPSRQHAFTTSRPGLAKHNNYGPTRLTGTGCASSPGQQQRRGPWVGGQTTHDRTIQAERPVDQLSQEGAKEEGIWLTPREAAPRPTMRSKMCSRFLDQLQRAPPKQVTRGATTICPSQAGSEKQEQRDGRLQRP